MAKYRRLRERVEAELPQVTLIVPHGASDDELLRVHTPDYLRRVTTGALSADDQRRIGFPWSPGMVERSRRSAGATLAACRAALADGAAANLAGGTHHAFQDRGEGYCVFNDAAVSARTLLAEGAVRRTLVIDCDVHQGNGTAAIFAGDPAVFTFDIFGAKNFPFTKMPTDLGVALDDGSGDEPYLAALEPGLAQAFEQARPDLAIYLAGADPFHDDRLGRLALTFDGLARRDAMVFDACRQRGVPVAVTMAGGYARQLEDTVSIHVATIARAERTFP
jgi:acetoin utilization deacetylase AcuC-like enzyme